MIVDLSKYQIIIHSNHVWSEFPISAAMCTSTCCSLKVGKLEN